jgi:serine phosphatase RsbU (regulator of sigma subunit)
MAAKADRVALEALRRSLVPAALPLVTGAEMAARYVPGRGVAGGDWYDVFTLPSGELSVVIGDVAGSGLPSASAQAVRLPRPRAELYEIARQRDLPGRSKMGREELARRLGED